MTEDTALHAAETASGVLSIRIAPTDAARLREGAALLGISVSQLLREAALEVASRPVVHWINGPNLSMGVHDSETLRLAEVGRAVELAIAIGRAS